MKMNVAILAIVVIVIFLFKKKPTVNPPIAYSGINVSPDAFQSLNYDNAPIINYSASGKSSTPIPPIVVSNPIIKAPTPNPPYTPVGNTNNNSPYKPVGNTNNPFDPAQWINQQHMNGQGFHNPISSGHNLLPGSSNASGGFGSGAYRYLSLSDFF